MPDILEKLKNEIEKILSKKRKKPLHEMLDEHLKLDSYSLYKKGSAKAEKLFTEIFKDYTSLKLKQYRRRKDFYLSIENLINKITLLLKQGKEQDLSYTQKYPKLFARQDSLFVTFSAFTRNSYPSPLARLTFPNANPGSNPHRFSLPRTP